MAEYTIYHTMKKISSHITIDPAVQFGKPIITGTRVPVQVIIGHIAAGMAIEKIMEEYHLTKEQVFAALKYASHIIAEETVMIR